jgi:hypothetical protein
MRSSLLLTLSLLAAAAALCGCSASPGAGSSPGESSGSSAGSSASAAAVPAGAVSTSGVCGLVPIAKVDSILGKPYANSEEIAIPELSMADAAYCKYTPASGTGQLVIQVATTDPGDAVATFNEATGGVLSAQSGIGDSALYTDTIPELVVVWDQTTIMVGQDIGAGHTASDEVSLNQLEKLATSVHAAS